MLGRKLLGKKYFKNRLADIYQYSRIPYLSGEGKCDQNIGYLWELCIDLAGNIIFILHLKDNDNFFLEQLCSSTTKITSFSGISCNKKWNIKCKSLHFLSAEIVKDRKNSIFYIPSSITLEKENNKNKPPNVAKADFADFAFSDINGQSEFVVNSNNKELRFNMIDSNKKLRNLIDIKRIDNAILSCVTIPINRSESLDSIASEAESISWFLSFLNLNTISVPIIEYLVDGDIVQYSIRNTTKKTSGIKYIIDNNQIAKGIPTAFDQCYKNYKYWQNQIKINILIDYLAEINRQEYIDIKLSNMIMAYEYFLTKYLIDQNLLPQTQTKKSIQNKLTLLNTQLRCIPRGMLNGYLRSSIRNPLFHQGEIPLMQIKDKIDTYKKYHDLLVKIVLKVLQYNGKYISIENNRPTSVR